MRRGKHRVTVEFAQEIEHDGAVWLVSGSAIVVCNYQPARLHCHPDDAYPDESEARIENTDGLAATNVETNEDARSSLLPVLAQLLDEDKIIAQAWEIT